VEEETHEEAEEEAPKDEAEIQVEQDKVAFRGFPYFHLVVFSFSMSYFVSGVLETNSGFLCSCNVLTEIYLMVIISLDLYSE
jgi:hypothetical protein